MNIMSNKSGVLNTWYHIVGTSSGSNHTLYVNGVNVETASDSSTFYSSSDPYKVGYGNAHLTHIGNVSNCRVYNRGLSEAEIKQNFNALRRRFGI